MMRIARVTALCLLAASGSALAADGAPEHLRLARYTTAAALPDPATNSPLAVVAQIRFPREAVATVGDALHYLLLRTGYRVGETDAAAAALLALPLPEAHREIGPYSVQAIASVLVGAAYELQVSEIDRRLDVALPEPAPPPPVAAAPAVAAVPLTPPAPPSPIAALTQSDQAMAQEAQVAMVAEPAAVTRVTAEPVQATPSAPPSAEPAPHPALSAQTHTERGTEVLP